MRHMQMIICPGVPGRTDTHIVKVNDAIVEQGMSST